MRKMGQKIVFFNPLASPFGISPRPDKPEAGQKKIKNKNRKVKV